MATGEICSYLAGNKTFVLCNNRSNRFISNWLKTITNIIPLAEDGEGVIGNPSIMGPLIAVLSMIG